MYSLFIDTSYKYLSVALLKDEMVLVSFSEECFKRQSEKLFVVIDDLFKSANIEKKDIKEVYITKGPGSYTGVRIAMSLAKVLCGVRNISLYTISTLKLYAGNKPNTMVIMDARANRAYVGVYDNGNCVLNDQVIELDKIDTKDYNVVLDGSLVNKEDVMPDIIDCFVKCKSSFTKVDDVNHLTPCYLKESDAYYR